MTFKESKAKNLKILEKLFRDDQKIEIFKISQLLFFQKFYFLFFLRKDTLDSWIPGSVALDSKSNLLCVMALPSLGGHPCVSGLRTATTEKRAADDKAKSLEIEIPAPLWGPEAQVIQGRQSDRLTAVGEGLAGGTHDFF